MTLDRGSPWFTLLTFSLSDFYEGHCTDTAWLQKREFFKHKNIILHVAPFCVVVVVVVVVVVLVLLFWCCCL